MKFRVEKYLYEKTRNVVFITIKDNAVLQIENYKIPFGGLDVPILTEDFINNVKKNDAQNNITISSIARGMIYILGIDKDFKYNEEYIKFLKSFDNDIENYIGILGIKKSTEKEYTDALIYFKALITINPNNLNGLYNYALVCQDIAQINLKNKMEKESEEFLLEALDKLETITYLYPEFALSYYQLGYHYYNQKQYLKSKITFDEALSIGVDENIEYEIKKQLNDMQYKVDYEQGYNLILNGKPKEGLEILIPLEEEYSTWWNLLFFIGLGYRQTNDINNALKYFEKIVTINPEQVDSLVEIGLCYAMTNNIKKSIEYFLKALQIKEDVEIMCNLGMAYLQDDDLNKAKEYINRAYELNPEDEITISCLMELKKYEK